jgi:hypothetical protein
MGLLSKDNEIRKAFRKVVGKSDWKSVITSTDQASETIERLRTYLDEDLNGDSIRYITEKIKRLTRYIQQAPPTMTYKDWENGQGG